MNNTHQLFLHIAEYIETLQAKEIKMTEDWARRSAEGSSVSQARYEVVHLRNVDLYSIDDHPRSKYIRIKKTYYGDGGASVHAFVDRETGSVYKPAGWKAPAKGKDGKPAERYNLLNDESRAQLLEYCEFSGAYLYASWKPRK